MVDRCNKRKPHKQDEPPRFKWNGEIVEDVLNALYQYECIMEFTNSDFNADKAKQYEAVRSSMASNEYQVENGLPFGPVEIEPIAEDEGQEKYLMRCMEKNKQIRKGYNRVQEKMKELRQRFS